MQQAFHFEETDEKFGILTFDLPDARANISDISCQVDLRRCCANAIAPTAQRAGKNPAPIRNARSSYVRMIMRPIKTVIAPKMALVIGSHVASRRPGLLLDRHLATSSCQMVARALLLL